MALLNISTSLFGRQVIYTSENEITKSNVAKVLKDALTVHSMNEGRITYYENYYKGQQPILQRVKAVRPEIDNKTVENHALEIVEFMVAQNFGEPVQYVRRGKDEAKTDEINKLNDFMYEVDKSYYDVELGRWQSMVGTAYRICYPDNAKVKVANGECPFSIDVPRPQDTFVVYSNKLGHKPMMGVYRTVNSENVPTYTCYTEKFVFEIKDEKVIKETANGVGKVLIVEYPNNSRRLSDIEIVEGLLNGINKITTNRLDGIEQFVQAFLVFINCNIDDEKYKALRQDGALAVFSDAGMAQADVKLIADELDQQQTQTAKDDLYNAMLSILAMPSREGNTGGDTGQAVYMRNGWDFAEKRAEINEEPVEKAEKEFLRIALKILDANQLVKLTIKDIEIKFTRSKTDNMVVKTQALMQQLTCGVDPQIALKTCELYADPEDVFNKSKDVMDARYGMGSLIKGQLTDKNVIQTTAIQPANTLTA